MSYGRSKVQDSIRNSCLVFGTIFGMKTHGNFGNCLLDPGALDGTPSYRDRLPTVGRLVWKAQALFSRCYWALAPNNLDQNDENCKPSNQVLLTQLLRSKISQEPTGAGFDVSI